MYSLSVCNFHNIKYRNIFILKLSTNVFIELKAHLELYEGLQHEEDGGSVGDHEVQELPQWQTH